MLLTADEELYTKANQRNPCNTLDYWSTCSIITGFKKWT